jgi:hypothetical protein
MGRAKRDVSAADAYGFDHALGRTRGGGRTPEQILQQRYSQIGEDVQEVLAEAVDIVADNLTPDDKRREQLIERIAKSQAQVVGQQYDEETRDVADALSVRRIPSDHIVRDIARDGHNKVVRKPVLHIWPDGHNHKDPSSAPDVTTLCGKQLITSPQIRVNRGVWARVAPRPVYIDGQSWTVCASCLISAGKQYREEQEEGTDHKPLGSNWQQVLDNTKTRLQERLAGREIQTVEQLQQNADDAYKQALADFLTTQMLKDPDWYLQQTVQQKKVRGMLRDAQELGFTGTAGELLGEKGIRQTIDWAYSRFKETHTMSTAQGMEIALSARLRELKERAPILHKTN